MILFAAICSFIAFLFGAVIGFCIGAGSALALLDEGSHNQTQSD